jgi:hypothetical protein
MHLKFWALAAVLLYGSAPATADFVIVYGGPTYAPGIGGFKDGYATSVNNAGTAIGTAYKYDASGTDLGARPFRWDAWDAPATELGNLGTGPSGVAYNYAFAINNAGTVVGSAERYDGSGEYPAVLPVRWDASGTVAVELANFGTNTSNYASNSAVAINNAGIAVGSTRKYNGSGGDLGGRAVRWDSSGTVATELGNLGTEPSGHTHSWASDINDAGTVVGDAWKFDASGVPLGTRAVRWEASGTVATELGNLGTDIHGFTYHGAYAINNAGTTVGYATTFDGEGVQQGALVVRWQAGSTVATELENLGTDGDGFTYNFGLTINNSGTVVGSAEKYDGSGVFLGRRAVRWDAAGTAATELGNLGADPEGITDNDALAINDAGITVGYAEDYDGSGTLLGYRAVYWNLNGVVVDFNTLIDPASGWTLEYADAISNTGWIAGSGMYDPDGPGAQAAYSRLFLMQVPALSVLPGDYNHDGVVDAADFVVWQKSPSIFGGESGYDTWRAHFGQTSGSGASVASSPISTIPEPGSLGMLLLGAALIWQCRLRPHRL